MTLPPKVPAFQFYPKDFLTDERVQMMCYTERGMYITLLCTCWIEGGLPSRTEDLARLLRIPHARFLKVWNGQIGKCFRPHADVQDRLEHKRLVEERRKQERFLEDARLAGQKSVAGAVRKHGRFIPRSVGKAHQRLTNDTPTEAPSTATKVGPTDHQLFNLQSSSASTTQQSKEHSAVPGAKDFIEWFVAEFARRRHGADYLVKWDRDMSLVKKLLAVTPYERLQKCAQLLLSDTTEDPFIAETARDIPILSVKFNWLSEKLAAWEAKQKVSA